MKKEGKTKRISVILCDCGGTLREKIDFKRLVNDLTKSDRAPLAIEMTSGFCGAKNCRHAFHGALKVKPAGIVIGACDRERYVSQLADVLKKEKFNEGLTGAVNIREHCAWVHPSRPQATDKAFRLLVSAIARTQAQEPIRSCVRKMCPDVVVLGGGMAGIQTALRLVELGRKVKKVTLVHRALQLGGTEAIMAPFFGYLNEDSQIGAREMKAALDLAVSRVVKSKVITVLSDAEVLSIEGNSGNFRVNMMSGKERKSIEAGAVVLAVGSFPAFPFSSSGIKPSARVIDLMGLASKINQGEELPGKKTAILMDICGEQTRAVNALAFGAAELLAGKYKKEVKLFCHHARVSATGLESMYRRMRSAGVVVVRSDKLPAISADENSVVLSDGGNGEPEKFDLAVCADSAADVAVKSMACKAQISPDPGGWLQYDNVWLLPALSTRLGIYVVGASRGNNDFRDAFNDAASAAGAIHSLLGSGRMVVPRDEARVDTDKCVLCLTCIRSCPHKALSIVPISEEAGLKPQIAVSETACRRCGICSALCPAQAIQLPRFTDLQTEAELERTGKTVVFACQNSAWRAATSADVSREKYGADVQVIPVPCAGKTDSRVILRALEKGASKVLLLGCHRENCRYLAGADYAAKRVERLRSKLEQAGFDGNNLIVGNMTEFESWRFLEYMKATE